MIRTWLTRSKERTCNPAGRPSRDEKDTDLKNSRDDWEWYFYLVLYCITGHKLCTVLAEPDERLVDVVHGKHDAEVAQSVHWGVPVISDHRRRDKSRELEPAVAIWRAHHGDLHALVAQSSDAPCPHAFYHGSPFELEAELSEKRDSGIEGFHHDADVVHSCQRHVSILSCVVRPVNERETRSQGCLHPHS